VDISKNEQRENSEEGFEHERERKMPMRETDIMTGITG
jgi:hypothetical protein